MFVGFAPWAFKGSAQKESVESGAPTFELKVSEPLLLMAATGPMKSVSEASSLMVAGTPFSLTMLLELSCSSLIAPLDALRERQLHQDPAYGLIDDEQVVGPARLVAAELAVEAGERRRAALQRDLQAGVSGGCEGKREDARGGERGCEGERLHRKGLHIHQSGRQRRLGLSGAQRAKRDGCAKVARAHEH